MKINTQKNKMAANDVVLRDLKVLLYQSLKWKF